MADAHDIPGGAPSPEARDHLRLALDAGSLGTWQVDATGRDVVWDERLEQLYGLPPGTFDGTLTTWFSLIHPGDRAETLARLRERSPERVTVRHRVIWPNGSERWIEAWVHFVGVPPGAEVPAPDEALVGTIGCARDVTEEVLSGIAQDAQMARLQRVADVERVNRQRLEFMLQINDALSSTTTVTQIMRRVTRAAVPRLGDWCFIHVLPHEGAATAFVQAAHSDPEMLEAAEQAAERMGYDLNTQWGASAVIRTGRPEYFPRLDINRIRGLGSTARRILASMGLRSSIVVPIRRGSRIYGAITFLMTFGSRAYTDEDLILAEAVAGRVAQALENLDLVAQQVEIARVLQASLLPATVPEIPGFEVAVRYTPAGEGSEVGGDFYDVFGLTGRSWGIAIGDVCGQGPRAAALTGLARHTIRTAAWRGEAPATVIARLNEAVYRSGEDSFCTAVYGVLDPSDRRLTAAIGGHPLPILVDADGGAERVGQPGMLIGAFPVGRSSVLDLHLPPGSSVVLYTDGVTDAPPPDEVTPARWTEVVGTCAREAGNADELAELLDAALDEIRPATSRRDDIALLVLHSI